MLVNGRDPTGFMKALPREARAASILDLETTGLDPHTDEVVELAVIRFAFDPRRGLIHGVLEEYTGLQEPKGPIPPSAVRIHGITDGAVRGRRLDLDRIASILASSDFIVAHNATFDRGFVTKLLPEAARKPWLCSMRGIDWYARGLSSRALQELLRRYRLEPAGRHRALEDARSLLRLLGAASPRGETNLLELLHGSPRFPARSLGPRVSGT